MSDEQQGINLGAMLNGYGAATWVWVTLLSLCGGVANFFRKIRAGAARPFNFAEFVGEIFISAFAGICTFLLCEAAHFNPLLSSAMIAVSGHMGSRAVFLFERIFTRRFGVEHPQYEEDITEPRGEQNGSNP